MEMESKMGTRCLTTVRDGNREILCMYRQYDGYPEGHGAELLQHFKGFKITNGISGDARKTANGVGCLAAQVVAVFKRSESAPDDRNASGGGCEVGGFYLYAPETREVGEEFVYHLSVKPADPKDTRPSWDQKGRIWLEVQEGEVAFFGAPGTPPALMDWLYSGWLDDFDPKRLGEVYHKAG